MTVKLSEIRSVRCTISRANGRLDADVVWCSPRTTARTGQPLDMVFASRVMRAASAHEIIGRRSEINMCSLSSTSLAVLVRPPRMISTASTGSKRIVGRMLCTSIKSSRTRLRSAVSAAVKEHLFAIS